MKNHLLSAVVAAAVLLTPAAPAAALTGEVEQVCTVGALAVPAGEPLPDEIPLVMSCFDSVADAEQFIESGAPGDLEQLLGNEQQSRAAAATVIIGRVWTGTARTGSVLIHWGTGTGCSGVTFGFPSLGSGWNDNIRSAQGYNSCWVSLYEHASYGGRVSNCTPYCSSLGTLAGTTSSIVYRPTGTFG